MAKKQFFGPKKVKKGHFVKKLCHKDLKNDQIVPEFQWSRRETNDKQTNKAKIMET